MKFKYEDLSQKQKEAIKTACNLYFEGQNVITIAGAAGTGKTTIAKIIGDRLGFKNSEIKFCTYTGRAALILNQKGTDATTIHSLIYNFKKKGRHYIKRLKPSLGENVKLIVVDEISMVGESLMQDILTFCIPIICLGDPHQLQPIRDNSTDYLNHPDIVLEERFRQEEGSLLLDFCDRIRKYGESVSVASNQEVQCVKRNTLTKEDYLNADQIICCTNKIRQRINNGIRSTLGFTTKIPEVGDKLICLHNYWEICDEEDSKVALVNGMTGYIREIIKVCLDTTKKWNQWMLVCFEMEGNENVYFNVHIDLRPFLGIAIKDTKDKEEREFNENVCLFDYGYAITVHKSQGSEWENVLVYTNFWGSEKKEMAYTAATRASKKLIWAQ